MKAIRPSIVVALLGTLLCPAMALAGDQDFTLVNKTGVTIDKVFLTVHDSKEWGKDIMGKDSVPDGGSVEIKFETTETADLWDLKIVDSKGNEIVWTGLKLTKLKKITLHYENGTPTADLE